MSNKQSLGEFLSLLRKANGYTQQDVAEKLNISNRTLSSWETDRTVPDVLMLPLIADLYGVTVDELLRGEKNQPDKIENVEFSDKAKRSIRKNRFGKFSSKCSVLSGFALASESVILLSAFLFLFVGSPFWLDIILFVLGVAGVVVCVSLAFYYANSLRITEGIVLKEDLTEENYAFALAIKHKCGKLVALLTIPVWVFICLIALIIIFSVVSENYITVYVIAVIISLILGVLPLVFSALYNRGFANLANDKQIANNKYNKKLATKICIFGCIPVLVLAILAIAFANPVVTKKEIYKNSDFEQFKTYLQTLTITEDSRLHIDGGAPVGEYVLDFSEEGSAEDEYKYNYRSLGNNFYGWAESYNTSLDFDYNKNIWHIFYTTDSNLNDASATDSFIEYTFFDESGKKTFVNLMYPELDIPEVYYDMFLNIHSVKNIKADFCDGYYVFYSEKVVNVNNVVMPLFIISIPVCSAVCAVIYTVKRKKQEFNF